MPVKASIHSHIQLYIQYSKSTIYYVSVGYDMTCEHMHTKDMNVGEGLVGKTRVSQSLGRKKRCWRGVSTLTIQCANVKPWEEVTGLQKQTYGIKSVLDNSIYILF